MRLPEGRLVGIGELVRPQLVLHAEGDEGLAGARRPGGGALALRRFGSKLAQLLARDGFLHDAVHEDGGEGHRRAVEDVARRLDLLEIVGALGLLAAAMASTRSSTDSASRRARAVSRFASVWRSIVPISAIRSTRRRSSKSFLALA